MDGGLVAGVTLLVTCSHQGIEVGNVHHYPSFGVEPIATLVMYDWSVSTKGIADQFMQAVNEAVQCLAGQCGIARRPEKLQERVTRDPVSNLETKMAEQGLAFPTWAQGD